ncbi:putative 8protein in POL 3'region [Trichinella spiralis]|uniref:8protein in POL 3'region n=1 Tax=Trichinella spiralis TaxID=6334 RepID=A0ABR3KHA5_TRISP
MRRKYSKCIHRSDRGRKTTLFEDTKRRAKSHCLILTKVGLFLLWSFKRFTAHKTFIEMPIAET